MWNQTGRARGHRVQAPQAINLLIGQDHASAVGSNDHFPVVFVDNRPLYPLDATDLPFNIVRHMPHIRANLFHPQEDVERIFPSRHPPVDEIRREVAAEQEDREAADRGALCREIGDDAPLYPLDAEHRPDGLDAQRVTRAVKPRTEVDLRLAFGSSRVRNGMRQTVYVVKRIRTNDFVAQERLVAGDSLGAVRVGSPVFAVAVSSA